jgi:hypothetical protein
MTSDVAFMEAVQFGERHRDELSLLDESSKPALGAPAWGLGSSHDLLDGSTVGMLGDRYQHGRVEVVSGGLAIAPIMRTGTYCARIFVFFIN